MGKSEADTLKVIISHDVDHLFGKEHWLRDLIYPKMWIRNSLEFLRREITGREWWFRNTSCFRKRRHNIDALMEFDEKYGIKSTFFFGMNQGLGMSYMPEEAKPIIMKVYERGFAVGVHGIEYEEFDGMKKEFETFIRITGIEPCGIRMHYVRFDDKTFQKLSKVGYLFDSTEFDKQNCGSRKAPYMVGNMWEFPLSIMDGYLPNSLEQMKQMTLNLLEECIVKNVGYVTILFHDSYFSNDYQELYQWYRWLIEYLDENRTLYSFVSFTQAVDTLRRGKQFL